jgi:Ribbon-helix-helix protein, copG family
LSVATVALTVAPMGRNSKRSIWRATSNVNRIRKAYRITLSDEVWAALGEIAKHEDTSRSAVIERLARKAAGLPLREDE